MLVRWTGLDTAGDTWEPLDNLTNCEAAIAAFEQATGRAQLVALHGAADPRLAPPPTSAATGQAAVTEVHSHGMFI